jgi:hypothetical protein
MQSLMLLIDEVFLGSDVLIFSLLLKVVRHFNTSLSLFLSFLLLSNCELLISQLPELGELHLFSLIVSNLLILAINLILSTLLDGSFHFSSPHFFFFEENISFVFSLGDLFIQ